jgi:hypothetical protein
MTKGAMPKPREKRESRHAATAAAAAASQKTTQTRTLAAMWKYCGWFDVARRALAGRARGAHGTKG